MSRCCYTGIVIDIIKFRDDHFILTIFTENDGLIKLITKNHQHRENPSRLIRAEFICRKTHGDLIKCYEIHVLDRYLFLRKTLEHLFAGGELIRAIKLSQLLGKPAPCLYKLLLFYLERLPEVAAPMTISSSYYLKVLKHDGMLSFRHRCMRCNQPLTEHFFCEEGCFCKQHAAGHFQQFTQHQVQLMERLTHCRSFEMLKSITVENPLADSIKKFFIDLHK